MQQSKSSEREDGKFDGYNLALSSKRAKLAKKSIEG